mgnify:CR=1 FL=1
MKGKLLKKLNESTPDSVKKIFSKHIRNKVINNKSFKNTLEELREFDTLDDVSKKNKHLEKLRDTLIYAYENTKYYKDVFDKVNLDPYKFNNIEDMKKIPTINKQFVLDNFDDIISKQEIDHYVAYTGGSTGKPLKILLDTDSIYKEKAFVYNYWSKYGYNYTNSRMITLRGLEFKNKIYKYNPIDNQIVLNPFMLNDDTIDEYIKIINKFKPEFIHGYASAIYNLCRIIDKKNIKLNVKLKGICFVSENVSKHEKEYIEGILECKSNIFYGHSERAVFAEWIDNSYKFNDLYTHVELIQTEEQGIYKIATTGLINKKMILINYVPDDTVEVKNNEMMIHGHWDKELLIGKNNERISMASINFHNKVFDKIKIYQFEQFVEGTVQLNIVEDEKITDKDKLEIINIINTKLKNILDVKINIVENIPLTKRGKHNKIVQHITN